LPGKFEQFKSKVKELVTERRQFPRREAKLVVKLPVGVSVPNENIDPEAEHYPLPIMGLTRDVSESGLSVIVPTLQLGDEEIAPRGYPLRLVLSLPHDLIIVQSQTVRSDVIEKADGAPSYLLGLSITRIGDRDRAKYLKFLQQTASSA